MRGKAGESVFTALAACYGYERMNADISRLCAAYPDKIRMEEIGISEQGRPIPVLCLGTENAGHQVLIQGAIHGREHMTAWLLMAMAEYWLEKGLPENACWHVIPMSNPDGVLVSQSGCLDEGQREIYERDLARGLTELPPERYAARWKANGLGVDLNRSFPSGWEPIHGPEEPSSERYKGKTPFEAVEAQALRDYTLNHSFDVTLSYHATGSVLYWEFGSRQEVNAASYSLGEAVSAVTGYPLEGCSSLEGGGYKDWVMEKLGIPSLTVEIGRQDAPLPEEERFDIFERNKGLLPCVARWLAENRKR